MTVKITEVVTNTGITIKVSGVMNSKLDLLLDRHEEFRKNISRQESESIQQISTYPLGIPTDNSTLLS